VAQAAGIRSVGDKEFLHRSVELNGAAESVFLKRAASRKWAYVWPSEANFRDGVGAGERRFRRRKLTRECSTQGHSLSGPRQFGIAHALRAISPGKRTRINQRLAGNAAWNSTSIQGGYGVMQGQVRKTIGESSTDFLL